MAQKRSAKEAFGSTKGMSAAAAARQARQLKEQPPQTKTSDNLIESVVGAPYTASDDDALESAADAKKLVLPRITLSIVERTALTDDDDENYVQMALSTDQSATFIGEYDLKVIKGVVNIYGAMIHPDLGPQRVYALSTHALPSITARSDSIIRIMSVKSGLLKLAKLSPLFRNIGAVASQRSFQFLKYNTSDPLNRPLLPLEVDEGTKRVLSRINAKLDSSSTSAILTVGPKSSGKSTFNRLLCNMIVSRPGSSRKCWYLDLDPGQPEFGPPGQVSLVEVSASILGPPYSHPASTDSKTFRLVRSHTIAATTFKDDAEHYIACAEDLVIQAAHRQYPMVINSCGWTSGLGASALVSIIERLASPPELVLLGESPESELSTSLSIGIPQHLIARRTRVQGTRTPAEQRAMVTMAYFHHKPTSKNERTTSWNPKPLSTLRPWLLSYKAAANPDLTAFRSYGQAPHPDFLAETLDGAIVAIVTVDSATISSIDVQRTNVGDFPYIAETEHPFLPSTCQCLGLALIRGIDVAKKTLQIITPVDLEAAEEAHLVLVRGGFDSPDWAYLEDLYHDPEDKQDRPWVALTGDSVEHGKVWRVRRPPLAGGGKT